MPYGRPGQYLDAQMADRNAMRSNAALKRKDRQPRPWEYGIERAEEEPGRVGPSEDAALAGASLQGIGTLTEAILAPMGLPGIGSGIAAIGMLTPAADAAAKNPDDVEAKARTIAASGQLASSAAQQAWSPMYHQGQGSGPDWAAETGHGGLPAPTRRRLTQPGTHAARIYGSPFALRRR